MVSKPKSTIHYESKSPSTSPLTSPLHVETLVSKQEAEKSTTTAQPQSISDKLTLESPKV